MRGQEGKKLIRRCLCLFLGTVSLHLIGAGALQAQQPVTLDLVLQPNLNKVQVLSLPGFGTGTSGRGTPFFNLLIRNNENRPQEDLYLDIKLYSDKMGSIAELYQETGRPFSLQGGQIVTGNTSQLQSNLPGVKERIIFDGGLTRAGEDFLNSLSGSTRLPADIYTVVLSIYKGNNSRNGGELVASAEKTFGEALSSEGIIDLYLLQPGGELGSGRSIGTTLPVFRWDGPATLRHRLVVVEDNGESPEALIQAALGSEPAGGIRGQGGNLLEFEMLDLLVDNLSFSFPPSGVQSLEPGNRYYWQVFTERKSVNGTENAPSEIWEFSIAPDGGFVSAESGREVEMALKKLIGDDRFNQLSRDGFRFISITVDGESVQGAAALEKLQEVNVRVDNGNISFITN